MNEYIYLSDRKVGLFVPEEARWWRRLRAKKASIGVGATKLDVELEHRDPEHLTEAQLNRVVESIDERCPWFEEPVGAGDWVFFEGRLGHHVVAEGPAAGAVLFYGVAGPAGGRRVLLHGSAVHLRGTPAPSAAPPAPGGYSTEEAFPLVVRSAEGALAPRSDPGLWGSLAGLLRRHPNPLPGVNEHVTALFGHIDADDWYTATAPYVAAVVRVTALLRPAGSGSETLVGSPLFVRSVRP